MSDQNDSGKVWLSAHLFMKYGIYGADADEVIKRIVAPVASECLASGSIARFFFIRYGEDGPHIRFRLWGHPDALENHVRPAILARVAIETQ